MQDNTGKVVLGLLGMVALWIAVYWWWPVDPPVSFAQSQSAAPPVFGTSDRPPPTLAQQPIDQIATPPVLVPPVPQGPGVIAPVFLQHTIGVGETLESISKMYYGSTDHTAAILAANPTKNPPDLKPGTVGADAWSGNQNFARQGQLPGARLCRQHTPARPHQRPDYSEEEGGGWRWGHSSCQTLPSLQYLQPRVCQGL